MADGKKELQASACAALGMVRQGDGGCRRGGRRRGEGEGSSHHFLPQLTRAPPLSIHQLTPASPDPPPPAQAAPFIGTPEPAFLRDLVKKLNAPAFQVRDGLRLLKAALRSWPHPLAAHPLPSSLILSPPPLPPGAPRPAGRHRLVRPGHREPTWAHEGVTILARRGREVCCGGCTPSTRSHETLAPLPLCFLCLPSCACFDAHSLPSCTIRHPPLRPAPAPLCRCCPCSSASRLSSPRERRVPECWAGSPARTGELGGIPDVPDLPDIVPIK